MTCQLEHYWLLMHVLDNGVEQNKDNIGLAGGGQKVGQCREKYKMWVENLIKLASLQTSFVTMDEALKVRVVLRLYYHVSCSVMYRYVTKLTGLSGKGLKVLQMIHNYRVKD